MKVVINADDFGLTKGVTDGIIHAHRFGVVTSTTTMCNTDHLEYASKVSKDYPNLGIGVHLVLTYGKSLTENKSLTNQDGNFFTQRESLGKEIDETELYNEWKAQILRFIEVFDQHPSHLDSHHMAHDFNEKHLRVANRLAKEFNLKLRADGTFKFLIDFYADNIDYNAITSILKEYIDTDIEVMCHPATVDLELYQNSSYVFERIVELDTLCDRRLKQFIKDNNITLTNYNKL